MAVLQTTILETPSAGQNGHIAASTAGLGETLVRLADANIGAGLFMCEGATPGVTAKAPATDAEARACIGCTIDPEYLNEIGAAADYLDGDAVTLLQKGYIWVNAEGTVAHDGKVYVRHTSDGGSNTTLGKVRGDSDVVAGGIVITPDASFAAAVSSFNVTLSNGVVTESFTFTSDATPTTAEVAAGLVALIDASANFASTGTVTVSVTSGTGVVEVVSIDERLPVTTPSRAAELKGARFVKGRTGAGLVKVRLQLRDF
jgi:hypothetical protein